MSKTTVNNRNSIAVPAYAVKKIGSRPLELVSYSGQHLLFASAGDDGEVVLSGPLGEIAVTDLLSFLNMFRKTGILRFELIGGSKALYFQQGEIVFATSTFPEDDLGEILYSLGKVDRVVLQMCRQFVTGRSSMGKVLVEKGEVAPKDLWFATRQQVETIIYSLFSFKQGSFSFLAKPLKKEDVVRLSLNTQNLIMEGLRRIDECALFMTKIRSLDSTPVRTDKEPKELSKSERLIFDLVGIGSPNIREVVRKSGLGEFDGLRFLYQLIEKGMLRVEPPPEVAVEGVLGEIFSVFNGALQAIYNRIVEKNPVFIQEVRCFLRDIPHPFSYVFRDVTVREDGTVDGAKIMANLAGLEEEEQKKLLADALSELIYMECMVARRELDSADAAKMIQRIQAISKRVKILIGSKE